MFLAFVIGGAVGTETQDTAQSGVGESGRAERTIDDAFPKHAVEQVLVQSSTHDRDGPLVQGSGRRRCSTAFPRCPTPSAFESPYAPGNEGQISADGHSALIRFEIAGDEDQAQDRVGATLDATAAAQAANPDFTVEQFGDASVEKQLNDAISSDFKQAFVTSLPITLVILLIAFGALVAASVPIILALTAVLATIGMVAVLSHALARRQLDQRGDPVDRARGRRRLLDVLPAPRARGARVGIAARKPRWRPRRRHRGGRCSSRA